MPAQVKIPKDSTAINKHRANIVWVDNNIVKFKQFYDRQWHADEIVEQSSGNSNYSASIGGGSNGQIIVIWSSEDEASVSLKYNVRTRDGDWLGSRLLTDQDGENLNSQVIFDSSNKSFGLEEDVQDDIKNIRVFDALGNLVLTGSQLQIQDKYNSLPSGIYIITKFDKNGQLVSTEKTALIQN